MDEAMRITRTIDTDLGADELHELLTTGWDRWLVDEADVEVRPGGGGTVVDDGVERAVQVTHVGPGGVTFTWWPQDRPDAMSTVELVVLPAPYGSPGSTLRVTETRALASTAPAATARWDVRLLLLLVACTPAHV